MILSELNGTLIFQDIKRNNPSALKAKIVSDLTALKDKTSVTDNAITFKTIGIYYPWGNSTYGYLLFRIYKEGKIVIEKEDQVIRIHWSVKLDTLYVLALFSSIAAAITAGLYADTDTVWSLITGIAFFLLFITLGILLIKYKMTELIEACVYADN